MPYDKNKAKLELEKIGLKHMRENMESQFLQSFPGILSSKKFNIDKENSLI